MYYCLNFGTVSSLRKTLYKVGFHFSCQLLLICLYLGYWCSISLLSWTSPALTIAQKPDGCFTSIFNAIEFQSKVPFLKFPSPKQFSLPKHCGGGWEVPPTRPGLIFSGHHFSPVTIPVAFHTPPTFQPLSNLPTRGLQGAFKSKQKWSKYAPQRKTQMS